MRYNRSRRLMISATVLLMLLTLVSGVAAGPVAQNPTPTPASPVQAVIAVERAIIFPQPDRNAAALTYVYERERIPVLAQHTTGAFLLTEVQAQYGWILTAQVDIEGDLALLPVIDTLEDYTVPGPAPTVTITPFAGTNPTITPLATASAFPTTDPNMTFPTRTPLPTQTPLPEGFPTPEPTEEGATDPGEQMLPGEPPPLTITLPDDWEELHFVVAVQTFDDLVRDIPLSIYFGPLDAQSEVFGLIYIYWGFPNTVDYTGQYMHWADGIQLLRGSLLGNQCNIGLYDQRMIPIGAFEGIGADYQSSLCEDEPDSAGWFAALNVGEGSYAFYTVIEPWNKMPEYRDTMQAILDTVVFDDLPITTAPAE